MMSSTFLIRAVAVATSLCDVHPKRARAIIALICEDASSDSLGTLSGTELAEAHYKKRKKVIGHYQEVIDRHLGYAKHETLRNVERHFRRPLSGNQESRKDLKSRDRGLVDSWLPDSIIANADSSDIALATAEDVPSPESQSISARLTFDKATFGEELLAALREESHAALQQAGDEFYQEIGRDDPWTMPARDTIDFLDRRQNLLADVPDEIHDQIKNAIIDGLEAGDTKKELIKRVEQAFQGVGEGRASTIASTETAAAYGYSRDKAMKTAGVKFKKWLISHSPFIKQHRPAHVAADGQVQPVDQPYRIGGEDLMYPGDENGSSENTINCHCISIPIAEEDAK